MTTHISIKTEEAMLTLGKVIGERVKPGDLLFLSGDLGAGKTTLTKGIAVGLNISETVTSPTFQLIKSYEGKIRLNHLDLYRLNDQSELDIFEPEELVETGVTVIEWGDLMKHRLGLPYLEIEISVEDNTSVRRISFQPVGARYEALVKEICNAYTGS